MFSAGLLFDLLLTDVNTPKSPDSYKLAWLGSRLALIKNVALGEQK
jgi:hypothetical protein